MTHLKEGDQAPDFSIKDESGNLVSLGDFKGKKLIIYFYPKDDTPGCTKEACNLRDHYELLTEKGFALLGVSADTERKHQNFIKKYQLPFPLLADTEKEMIQAYGVWGLKKFMGREFEGIHRETFVVSGEGIIERVFTKVKSAEHTQQILSSYE